MRQEGFWCEAAPSPQRALGTGKGPVSEHTINPARQREGEQYEYRGGKSKETWVDEKEKEEYMKVMWNYEKLHRAREGKCKYGKENEKRFETDYKIM